MLSTPQATTQNFADKTKMQHRLFAELSAMFGKEVPLYDKSLLVNRECNKSVVEVLSIMHPGFTLSDEQLDKTSGERHGAIRIGTPDEYRWVAGFFAAFNLAPHNFYDMTSLGGKSQPIIATAFRSPLNPEHRVFCSLLMIDSFTPEVRKQVEDLLAKRQVFSDRAKELILKNEADGGLTESEAEELVREGTERIFKWTGKAHDYALYQTLCDSGFKIAADIACFESHHLNHLTPNTFCMDLYTAAMKFCLGDINEETFREWATYAFDWLRRTAGHDYVKLHFRHLTHEAINVYGEAEFTDADITRILDALVRTLSSDELALTKLNHSGFKDFTEGPDVETPILLRQDSYKALTEPVKFYEPDGSVIDSVHTARFGEIEQRFYATTETGRSLYDESLAAADAERAKHPGLAKQDYSAYLKLYAEAFSRFPKELKELLEKGLVFGRYSAVADRSKDYHNISTTDMSQLLAQGYVQVEGLRYEDFLPFSAAGIFASNLGQYGTESASDKVGYTQSTLEEIMGRAIVDPNVTYKGLEAESILTTYRDLNILAKVSQETRKSLEDAVNIYKSALSKYA